MEGTYLGKETSFKPILFHGKGQFTFCFQCHDIFLSESIKNQLQNLLYTCGIPSKNASSSSKKYFNCSLQTTKDFLVQAMCFGRIETHLEQVKCPVKLQNFAAGHTLVMSS